MWTHLRLTRTDLEHGGRTVIRRWAIHGVRTEDPDMGGPAEGLPIRDALAWLTESELMQLISDYNSQIADTRDSLVRRGVLEDLRLGAGVDERDDRDRRRA